jgi:hypothetical protein
MFYELFSIFVLLGVGGLICYLAFDAASKD